MFISFATNCTKIWPMKTTNCKQKLQVTKYSNYKMCALMITTYIQYIMTTLKIQNIHTVLNKHKFYWYILIWKDNKT